MLIKKEKYRQILFLMLIIGCTVMVYTNWYLQRENRNSDVSNKAIVKTDDELLKDESATQKLFSSFIKNPNSEEGVNSLFDAVVRWELNGKKDSVQLALKKFETVVKNESLKNSFYNRLGQFYISSYKEISFSSTRNKTILELLKLGKV